ncbi:MAG: hypothetical protein M9929_12685, partial [Burkholderiaceae bacterium]|nr:hypothetical protein [Burkholderiaceae bacterium]
MYARDRCGAAVSHVFSSNKTPQRNAQALFILQRCFHNPNTGKTMLTWDEEVTSSSQESFDGGLQQNRLAASAPPSA